jgi:hypothetical protein
MIDLKKIHAELRDMIDTATAPEKMSKQDAVFVIGELMADLESRYEALEQEIEG